MKISNSTKQLARIISENGGWCDGEFAAQDKDGEVFKFDSKPVMGVSREVWMPTGNGTYKLCCCATIKGWHQTILSRDEYFHLYPVPDADGWIAWKGGECPVDEGVVIDVKFRNGTVQTACAARCDKSPNHRYWTWIWSHSGHESDIIAYRLHKPEQAKSTAVGDDETNLATKEEPEAMEYKPTIEQLAADYRNLLDFAQRKQQEADAAKADADAKLAELVAAGKALGLVLSAATTEPELVITGWRDLRPGDIVEFLSGIMNDWAGREVTVKNVDVRDTAYHVLVSDAGETRWCRDFRFIRRP